jgi:hypothetical protein
MASHVYAVHYDLTVPENYNSAFVTRMYRHAAALIQAFCSQPHTLLMSFKPLRPSGNYINHLL